MAAKKAPAPSVAVTPVSPPAAEAARPTKLKGKARKSMLKETSARISQLASDILADRIIPTIDQIKALAASTLGQGDAKGKKGKRKKK
jgi:hypothetical protein